MPRKQQGELSRLGDISKLERWARSNVSKQVLDQASTDPRIERGIKNGLKQYCYAQWAMGETKARNFADIVYARLLIDPTTFKIPVEAPNSLSIEEESTMSIGEMIAGYRKTIPKPPVTDFPIQEG